MPAFESTLAYAPTKGADDWSSDEARCRFQRAKRLTRRSQKPKSADGGPLLPEALKHGRAGKVREPLGVAAPAARLSSLRVDWPAQPPLNLAQNYFCRTS
jgi:hypothetical protein